MVLLTLVAESGHTVKVSDGTSTFTLPTTFYERYIKKNFDVKETFKVRKTKFIDKLLELKSSHFKVTYTNKEDVEKTVEGIGVKISNLAKLVFYKDTREFITIDMRKISSFVSDSGIEFVKI